MEGTAYTTQYSYDGNGSLVGMTYPSGLVVDYQRDGTGRVSGVRVNGQTLAGAFAYLPFGPLAGLTLGSNLLNLTRTYDQRYQLKTIQAGPLMDYQYTYDPAGNITAISGVTEPTPSGETRQHEYTANRLQSSTGKEQRQYTYDGAGNIVSDGVFNFTYNQSGRLVRVSKGGDLVAEYAYDGLARRVKKTVAGSTTLFHYDRQANLIAETRADGTPLRDIIYLDGERIAMKLYGDQAGIYYFLNDHLGTPHIVINTAGQIVWHAAYLPFGLAQILTEQIPNPFRFPGQYFDPETGLHYNYFRYYDPKTGRYLTPDPIGIKAGLNLFAYVGNNPSGSSDPLGLWKAHEHRLMTVMAMRGKGFTPDEIQMTVRSNLAVDALTNQFNSAAHYMPGAAEAAEALINKLLEEAVQRACRCERKSAMKKLGQALHTVQDRYSHFELQAGWVKHLPFIGISPDDPRKHSEHFRSAMDHSEFLVDVFLNEVEKRCN
jgi:RHS repeat-associated protein